VAPQPASDHRAKPFATPEQRSPLVSAEPSARSEITGRGAVAGAFGWCASLYRRSAMGGVHLAILAAACASILLLPAGVSSSAAMIAIIYLGVSTLLFDRGTSRVLGPGEPLFVLAVLFGLILAWEGLGILARHPVDPRSVPVLVSAVGIVMLLPVVAGAIRYDPKAVDRLLVILFALGSIAALVSIVLHVAATGISLRDIVGRRLIPIGRAHHEILGAGGLASAFFAGVALFGREWLRRSILAFGLGAIAFAILLTQSRGPILGLGLALISTLLVTRLQSETARLPLAIALVLACFAVPLGLVLGEPWIKALICSDELGLCRVTLRQDVWQAIMGMIPARPWFGIGPAFRFPSASVNHAHNALLGLSFFFGLPMAALFGATLFVSLRRILEAPTCARFYGLSGLFFSAAFIATDLSNPFAFINTHYLFLWLPLLVGAVAGSGACIREIPRA
jgi:hypothetical protein